MLLLSSICELDRQQLRQVIDELGLLYAFGDESLAQSLHQGVELRELEDLRKLKCVQQPQQLPAEARKAELLLRIVPGDRLLRLVMIEEEAKVRAATSLDRRISREQAVVEHLIPVREAKLV